MSGIVVNICDNLAILIYIFIIIIIILFWEFFTPALADGFQLECEGQRVSSSLQVPQFLYKSFCDCTERANYNWYHRHIHVP